MKLVKLALFIDESETRGHYYERDIKEATKYSRLLHY